MATVEVSAALPMTPEEAWHRASDLSRFDEWLTLHDGWRCALPDTLRTGTELVSVVAVKGIRSRVTWRITDYLRPEVIELRGDAKGGVSIAMSMRIHAAATGSELRLRIEFTGAPVFGLLGTAVARAVKGDLRRSMDRLVALS
ncbi:MAG: type II toxin-antitoxin system Rv0910 family toxin [Sciscionella sp.]